MMVHCHTNGLPNDAYHVANDVKTTHRKSQRQTNPHLQEWNYKEGVKVAKGRVEPRQPKEARGQVAEEHRICGPVFKHVVVRGQRCAQHRLRDKKSWARYSRLD
jgi:hypothetical protein